MAQKNNYRMLEGNALIILAEVHHQDGRTDLAIADGERVLTVYRETGHRLGVARIQLLLGRAELAAARAKAAAGHWERALTVSGPRSVWALVLVLRSTPEWSSQRSRLHRRTTADHARPATTP